MRSAFAAGGGEAALVPRCGWQPVVRVLDPSTAGFVATVLAYTPLAAALHVGGAAFDFEAWFGTSLRQGLLVAVDAVPPDARGCPSNPE